MGLMDKFKNLFTDEEYEEEEIEEPVKIKEIKKEKKEENKLPTFMREKIEKEEKEPQQKSLHQEASNISDFSINKDIINDSIMDSVNMNENASNESHNVENNVQQPVEQNKKFKFPIAFEDSDFTDISRVSRQARNKKVPSKLEREAAAYDREAVEANMKKKAEMTAKDKIEEKPVFHGCPGTRMKMMDHKAEEVATEQTATVSSQLSQWPVQIKLVPVNAPYFKDANLLIAADCTAYAYGNFHQEFIKNKVTLIGCPKLDEGDYSEKLTQIIANNDIKSVTIVRMEVPCCGGLEMAAKRALQDSGKFIPWQVVTIGIDGSIME